MQISKRKVFALFAIVSMIIVSSGMMVFSNAVAVPNRKTAAYMSVAPKLIGLGQQLTVTPWIAPGPSGPTFYNQVPDPATGLYSNYANVTVTFTRPDGSKDTFMPTDPSIGIPGMTESGGWMFFYYTPNQVGTWSATFSFPGQTFTTPPSSDTVYYEPSSSQPFTFTVQQDKVVESGLLTGWPWSPLPTGYWQRPVNINNREWSAISGDWPQPGYDSLWTSFNPYTTAPNTAHIVWDNQVTQGGIVGGQFGSLSYGGFGGLPGIVLDGKVYYNDYAGGTFSCVDLRTGELLYRASGSISGAQNVRLAQGWGNTPGSAGAAPILSSLWSFGGVWKRYDPMTGVLMQTITNAPTNVGATAYENGNPVFYIVQRWGFNTTIPLRWAGIYLIKWDFSRLWGSSGTSYGVIDNNWQDGIVWNVTLTQPDGTQPGMGRSTKLYPYYGANVVAISCDSEENMVYGYDMTTGNELWATNVGFIYLHPPGSVGESGPNGPFIAFDPVTNTLTAIDVKTGNKLWVSDKFGTESPWGGNAHYTGANGYGNFYVYTADGHAYAIDLSTGKLKWESESIGNTTETIYGTWPDFNVPGIIIGGGSGGQLIGKAVVADGKFYFSTGISWGAQPYTRFHKLWCMDTNTGELLWNVTGAFAVSAIAEGYLVGVDTLNGMMYTFGKGRTETTVSIQNNVIAKGASTLIEGTVMDLSPAQPNTPAVADESMSEWMDYLHMQNATLINNPPIPKGIPVLLYAIDPNGNYQEIGTVTSDSNGLFKKLWTPEIEGEYTIYATFMGSESYWTSTGVTALGVTEAPATNGGTEQLVSAAPDYTLLLAVIAVVMIIIAILVVYQIVRKKQ